MTEDKTDVLKKKYPKIFPESFWFECDDGWFDLIDNMCLKIQTYIDDFDNVEQVEASQVKEKFGGLRFYIYGGDDYVYSIIQECEKKSVQICETCGVPGTIQKFGNWYVCRCAICFAKDEETRKSRMQ